jgi:hypothetical protein
MAAPGSLAEEDASLFYKLYQSFLAYSGQKTGVAPELRGRDDFLGLETEEKAKIRDASYKSGDLLGEFVESNPFNFASEEIELVKAWKDYVRGTFYVVRLTREGAIFLEEGKDAKSFLVLALGSPLEELLPFRPPVRVEAVLLPFKGRIVYDGLLRSYRLYIGGGMSRSIRAACDDAILKYGIITSLPYAQAEREVFSEGEKLAYYLKTKERREEHYEEIEQILRRNPRLLPLYQKEIGRANSRHHVDALREVGVERGWFAISCDVIVASGRTKEEVQKSVDAILPQDKRGAVHLFELK